MQQSTLKFAVFSDMHFMSWRDTLAPVESVPTSEHALRDTTSLEPAFMVVNGDLTNGKIRDYELAMRIIHRTTDVPVYYTMGNHEYYGFYEDEDFSLQLAQERFLHFTKQTAIYYEHRINGHTFIFLSTERYAPDMKDAGWLSPEQLAWFRQHLISAPKGPVFVFFHQPVNHTVAESEFTCYQSDELREILSRRPGVLFFTGHTHCRMDQPEQLSCQNGTWFIGGGCTCSSTPQSRWVEVYPDHVVLRIRDHLHDDWVTGYDATIPTSSN